MFNADDHAFMAHALRLAERGRQTTHPNPRVGCVLVREGHVVGTGWHRRAGEPHAEIHALEAAGERATGATAYVSLEPCCHQGRTPPCTEALIGAGVARVIAAAVDPNPRVAGQGIARLRDAGIDAEAGLMEESATELNRGFFMRMREGRPFVTVKLAASLDGRTALADGTSQWITGEAARRDVHRLRAEASAILTGIGTVLADDPRMTARREPAVDRQPLRVVLDSALRMPVTAAMLSQPGETLVLTTERGEERIEALTGAGARVQLVEAEADRVSLGAALNCLAEMNQNEVLVEAGAELAGALLERGLVDELVVYLAPHLIGADGRGMFALPALRRMDERTPLTVLDVRRLGGDLRLTLRPVRAVSGD
ncbi:MAG: bifunctional diaminohydroxyphosphoribosylaminopyrimidine deaminase/5-amino-6-(5-phosphoribosylamino)uracil reductase RibD [Gammaproteobacteria bacterium]|jgi:diaminohydroxyphosphoribosylaminopyrimidine deaminase/5-amino-6-(5-phosphoribosylamino)uracil reductase